MIWLVEWLSSLLATFGLRMRLAAKALRGKASSMRTRRMAKLVGKSKLTSRESKELANLLKGAPDVVVNRRS